MGNLYNLTKDELIDHYVDQFNCSRDEAIIMVEEDENKRENDEQADEYGPEEEPTREEVIAELMDDYYYSYEEAVRQVNIWDAEDKAAKKHKLEMGRNKRKRKNRNKHKHMAVVHQKKKTTIDHLKGYKIFVVGNAKSVAKFTHMEIVNDIEEANLVMFTGGSDINPELYGENEHPRTYTNEVRDNQEIQAFRRAKELGKRMIGICRGAQLLCVMSGGRLLQHVTGHGTPHRVECLWKKTPTTIYSTSTHHQMMYPFDMPKGDYVMLGYSTEKLSKTYEDGNQNEVEVPKDFVESEILMFPKNNALAIQGHPESFTDKKSIEIIQELILGFMLIKNVNVKTEYETVK